MDTAPIYGYWRTQRDGHVYPATSEPVFTGPESEDTYRYRNSLLVAALRSGEFTQVSGALEKVRRHSDQLRSTPMGNCCLGVACHVAIVKGYVPMRIIETPGNMGNYAVRFEPLDVLTGEPIPASANGSTPPGVVAEWFGWGMHNSDPYLFDAASEDDDEGWTNQVKATQRNDDRGQDFATIADAFERTFVTWTRAEKLTTDPTTTEPSL